MSASDASRDPTDLEGFWEAVREVTDGQRRFRLLTETIDDVIWIRTPKTGRVMYISPAYQRVFRRSLESLHADPRSFLEVVHPDDRAACQCMLEGPHASAEPYNIEYRIVVDEEIRWIHERGFPTHGLKLDLMTVVCTDITRHRELATLLATSQALLDETGNLARVGRWAIDARTGEVSWTAATRELLQIRSDAEPTVDLMVAAFDPADRPRVDAALQCALHHGEAFNLEAALVFPDSHRTFVRLDCRPMLEGGKVYQLTGAIQDVTIRRADQRRFQQYLDVAGAMLVALDKNGRITLVNRRAREVLGCASDADALGKRWFDTFIPKRERETLENAFREWLAGNTSGLERTENEIVTCRGERRLVAWRNALVRDDAGKITGTLSSGEDITEMRALQTRMAQSERFSSVGMLAAGVAHEINNPLSYILFNLQSLAEDVYDLVETTHHLRTEFAKRLGEDAAADMMAGDPAAESGDFLPNLKRRFDDCIAGATRIQEIVAGLGTFSQLEEGDAVPIDVNRAVEVATNLTYNQLKYCARLVKDVSAVPEVLANEGRLSQVLVNLLLNAAEAIEPGAVAHNEIRVSTRFDGRQVVITVRDTGRGIEPENLPKVFDPFFTTKDVGSGTGLGLAIARNLVNAHGGELFIESNLTQGTVATVTLPAIAPTPNAKAPSRRVANAGSVNGRILLIDDEARVRLAVRRMLRDHTVVEAASGAEAIEILQRDAKFDVVVCDMMMPDVSGSDVHKWLLSSRPELADRVVFVTGGALSHAKRHLRQTKNVCLDKPVDRDELAGAVQRLVRQARLGGG